MEVNQEDPLSIWEDPTALLAFASFFFVSYLVLVFILIFCAGVTLDRFQISSIGLFCLLFTV